MALGASAARAHEFWIAPQRYAISPSQSLVANLLVGQNLSGAAQVYMPGAFTRFDIVQGDRARPVEGRMGDRPALDFDGLSDGLAIVVHETVDFVLTYDDFGAFERFAEHKDFQTAIADHRARGLPDTGFTETYRRFAKSLVAVGTGAGADRVLGLRIEIVALANPYTDDVSGGLPLLVMLDGAPRPGAQVELFRKAPDGSVRVTLHRTGADGIAVVPVEAGMEYLADNVVLRRLPNDDPVQGPVWHTDWASLTFRIPD